MLTSLLSAIQGAFASFARGFLIVALVPTVLFVAANLAILSAVNWAWFIHLKPAALADGLPTVLWIVGLAAAALVLSALQPLFYRLTEGEALPAVLRWYMHSVQRYRLDCMRDQARTIAALNTGIDMMYDGWVANLTLPPRLLGGSVPSAATLRLIRGLESQRRMGREISFATIQKAVYAMFLHLAPGPNPTPPQLRDSRRDLIRIIRYARDNVKYQNRTVHNQLQASFPGEVFDPTVATDNILAPTGFGNIGRTMRSYALRRYSMDLDIFWTRFQKAMADTSSKMPENLAGQKNQVDFLVNMLWLTLLTGAFWTPALWLEGAHPVLFVGAAIITPALAWLLYDAACRAYLVFADQLRAAVDFFRFDVLSQLQINAPNGTSDEEELWARLGNRIGYARKDATFVYVRKP
jgi:hypothetical protein